MVELDDGALGGGESAALEAGDDFLLTTVTV